MPGAELSHKAQLIFVAPLILISITVTLTLGLSSGHASGPRPISRVTADPSHNVETGAEFANGALVSSEYSPEITAHEILSTCLTGTVVPSPNLGANGSNLTALAPLSATDMWAVGYYIDLRYLRKTLVEHWDGSTWSVIPSPNADVYNNSLFGVTALSANDVWAVGFHDDYTYTSHQTLVEHWDGSTWSVVQSPNRPSSDNHLAAVSAVSANDVWAVGSSSVGAQNPQTLVEHWDGTTWSVNPSGSSGLLEGVSAVSADDVWAVGTYELRTLTEHWDGVSWSIVPSPNLSPYSELRGVTAISSADVWAVGSFENPNTQIEFTLIEHWDGTSWSVITSPNPDLQRNLLFSVSAISTDDVWAVGNYLRTNVGYQTLVEHWDGSTWSTVPSPNATGLQDELYGVTTIPGREAWAVGFSGTGNGSRTLVEHFVRCSPPPCPGERFTDVCPTDYFYTFVLSLAQDGIVSGYSTAPPCPNSLWVPCFNPYNTSTRGQISKIVSLAAGFTEPVSGQSFEDVLPGSTFYTYTQRMAERGIISGYACGGPGEPCIGPQNRPYFRTNSNVTRGQLSKMIALAFNWAEPIAGQQFQDVPVGSTFYDYIGRLFGRGIINGYPCGGATEPCVPPQNLPYFRPSYNILRGQTAKIVDLALTQPSPTPTPAPITATPSASSTATPDGTSPTLTPTATSEATKTVQTQTANGASGPDFASLSVRQRTYLSGWAVFPSLETTTATATTSATPVCNAGWLFVDGPHPNTQTNNLRRVTTLSENDAWAIGYTSYPYTMTTLTLIEHWNGIDWSIVPGPNPSSVENYLSDVKAIASNDVWAVGYTNLSPPRAFIIHWNGVQWSVVPNPPGMPDSVVLSSLDIISPNDIWVVGASLPSAARTFTAHYDGNIWIVVPSPNIGSQSNGLTSVSAVSTDDVWAVGRYIYDPVNNVGRALTMHWDGVQWSIVANPDTGYNRAAAAVKAISHDNIWLAGGGQETDGGYPRNMTMHWDGAAWANISTPNDGDGPNNLEDLTAISANDIWAVGNKTTLNPQHQETLILHWDGAQWSVVPSPNPGMGPSSGDFLWGISAISHTNAWAVGSYATVPGAGVQPLTLHLNLGFPRKSGDEKYPDGG